MRQQNLVILDRDGVINQDSPSYVKSAAEWRPIPGSLDAIARFTQAGWKVAIASNQAGIARGRFTLADLDEIHQKMRRAVHNGGGHIDALAFCPHGPDDDCECRKPRPGLLTRIGSELGMSLDGVPFIGDKVSDIDAARTAGAQPVLVLTGNGCAALRQLTNNNDKDDVVVVPRLADAATQFIAGH